MDQETLKILQVEVHLYGALARYGGDRATKSHARLEVQLAIGAKMRDLLDFLTIPADMKGLTFINAVLSDMPGLLADLDVELHDRDRVGIFSKVYAWPLQYRAGAIMTPQLKKVLGELDGAALQHSPKRLK